MREHKLCIILTISFDEYRKPSFLPKFEKLDYAFLNLKNRFNKRRGAPRDGEGRCAGCDASEGNVSDVEVRLHDMHVHDQLFITKNDEHFEEISMKQ